MKTARVIPLCSVRTAAALVLMIWRLLSSAPVIAADDTDAVEPPVVNRPANFSNAVGSGFSVQMRAAPTRLQAEDPLILTVSITGPGSSQAIERPDLRRLPHFAEQFHIENLADRYLPAKTAREFDYRLRPRSPRVKEVPPLPFVFFNPKIIPLEKGYQVTLAKAIPLTVQPRGQVSPGQVEGKALRHETPDSVYQLVDGVAVLRHDPPYALPGPFQLGALLIGPPLLSGLWYIVWQRRYPNATREARKRRSRAAQHALKTLHRSGKPVAVTQVESIVAGYLRQRLDLLTAEPTPTEVARHLEQMGSSPALAQEVSCFFADCYAARFAPGLNENGNNWTATATRLVLALEEESWPWQLS